MNGKRGLSGIVTVMIIILLAVVLAGIVWGVVSNVVNENAKELEAKSSSVDVGIRKFVVDNDSQKAKITAERKGPGVEKITGLKLVLETEERSFDKDFPLDIGKSQGVGQVGTGIINLSGPPDMNSTEITKVSLYPRVEVDGSEFLLQEKGDEHEAIIYGDIDESSGDLNSGEDNVKETKVLQGSNFTNDSEKSSQNMDKENVQDTSYSEVEQEISQKLSNLEGIVTSSNNLTEDEESALLSYIDRLRFLNKNQDISDEDKHGEMNGYLKEFLEEAERSSLSDESISDVKSISDRLFGLIDRAYG